MKNEILTFKDDNEYDEWNTRKNDKSSLELIKTPSMDNISIIQIGEMIYKRKNN